MINKVSSFVSKWLLREGAITENDQSIYTYAVYSLLFGMAPVAIALLLGALFNMVVEGIFLIIPFMLIRKFSGGCHLSSSKVCGVISTSMLVVAFLLIKLFSLEQYINFLFPCVIISVICVFTLSPIDSKARQLSENERKIFRSIARILSLIFLLVYLVLLASKYIRIAASVGVGILVVAALQIPCLVSKYLSKDNLSEIKQ